MHETVSSKLTGAFLRKLFGTEDNAVSSLSVRSEQENKTSNMAKWIVNNRPNQNKRLSFPSNRNQKQRRIKQTTITEAAVTPLSAVDEITQVEKFSDPMKIGTGGKDGTRCL
jgi:hypothetical protein